MQNLIIGAVIIRQCPYLSHTIVAVHEVEAGTPESTGNETQNPSQTEQCEHATCRPLLLSHGADGMQFENEEQDNDCRRYDKSFKDIDVEINVPNGFQE